MNSTKKPLQSGSVMVEMAGALTLLVFLVFGITELGRALYQLNTINKAVTSGARYLSRVEGVIGAPIENPPCGARSGWVEAVARAQNIVVYGNEDAIGSPVLEDMDVLVDEPEIRTYEVNGETKYDCIIAVHASAVFHSLFGGSIYLPLFGQSDGEGLVLRADSEERYLRLNYASSP